MANRHDTVSQVIRRTSYRPPIVLGLAGFLLMAGGIGTWAVTAPIEGAAMAPGELIARGDNITIQHLEGGIVAATQMKEGDRVSAQDILVTLDTTQSAAELLRLRAELDASLAREAALLARRDGAADITFPAELVDRVDEDPSVGQLMEDLRREHRASELRRKNEIAILHRKIAALEVEIEGYRSQHDGTDAQIELLNSEIERIDGLYEKGLVTQDRFFLLRRQQADLKGKLGGFVSSIGQAEQRILENQQEIERLTNETVEVAARDLVKVRVEMAEMVKGMTATRDVLNRAVVRAGVDGVVIKSYVNAAGRILAAGDPIADILPSEGDLVVEARVDLSDIDRIEVGQDASVRIPALHIPYSPMIPARVEYVSADSMVDQDTGQAYYVARLHDIQLPSDMEGRLRPGMQVESFILTEPRTFARYMLEPVWDSFMRSLKEK